MIKVKDTKIKSFCHCDLVNDLDRNDEVIGGASGSVLLSWLFGESTEWEDIKDDEPSSPVDIGKPIHYDS